MLEQIYNDVKNLGYTLERYEKMLTSLKEVAMHCNEISSDEWRNYSIISHQIHEMQTSYEIILLELNELQSYSRQDKEG